MNNDEREGFASLARFTADGRELVSAAAHFSAAGRGDMLPELLRIAMRCGVINAVCDLRQRLGLSLDNRDFVRWFHECGALWFDIYEDGRVAWVKPEDAVLYRALVKDGDAIVAWAGSDGNLSPERRALLRKLISGEEPVVALLRQSVDVDKGFRDYCHREGIVILRTLQQGRTGLNRRNWVYAAKDRDGIVKVFKSVEVRTDNRLGVMPTESEIYSKLCGVTHIPNSYETVDIGNGFKFLKMSFCFGHSLAEYVSLGNSMDIGEAINVVAQTASIMSNCHARGVLHLDLRLENIIIGAEGANVIDFNVSRFAASGGIDSFPFDPRYAAPEMVMRLRASEASDVFSLGVIFHLLLTGEHPFCSDNKLSDNRATALECFGLANAFKPLVRRLDEECSEPRLAIVSRMLDKDPLCRPVMAEVVSALSSIRVLGSSKTRPVRELPLCEKNGVIFPARMGIPHNGHIDYLSRLIDLGFCPVISLQRSFTLTERDPLPKWIVMKMIARSLQNRGYRIQNIRFLLTPFFETDEEMQMYFAMMPGFDDIVAVATGNSDVPRFFPGLPVINQQLLFGRDGEKYDIRSWGEILRRAVRENDRATFDEYAASGVSEIMSFDEIRTRYAETPIDFVLGKVRFLLVDDVGTTVCAGRLRRYLTPEENIIRALDGEAKIIDPFTRDTVIERFGQRSVLRYESTEKAGDDIILRYQVI